MTAGLLDLVALADEAGVPVERLREYAEVGLLPPARRDGDRFGYPAAEAATVRLLADAERLGLGGDLPALATAWRQSDCAAAGQRLADAVGTRLEQVQGELTEHHRRAADAVPGSAAWADVSRSSVALTEDTARLQAVAEALTVAGYAAHAGRCGSGCGCATALATSGTRYHFPAGTDSPDSALACNLGADDGDVHGRIGVWQQVLGHVVGRDPLPDTATGVALRFPLEADLAATLAGLAAAEYRCCSFGSYTLVVDERGLRLEVRMPAGAADVLAAVVGLADSTASTSADSAKEGHDRAADGS